MANQKCAICGAEINLLQQQKLVDGSYICRKVCQKRGMKDFDYIHANLDEVEAHIKQVEDGTKIYEKLFIPRKNKQVGQKPETLGNTTIAIAEDIGLMAKIENRYKFFIFGKTSIACVYRIADLYGYELEQEEKVNSEGKKETINYTHFYFWDTDGMADFRLRLRSHNGAEKYFNKLFGIQKTIGNIKNTWKNQINAAKAMGSAAKSVISGSDDVEAKAEEAGQALDRMQFGDRTEWIAKAEKALSEL